MYEYNLDKNNQIDYSDRNITEFINSMENYDTNTLKK